MAESEKIYRRQNKICRAIVEMKQVQKELVREAAGTVDVSVRLSLISTKNKLLELETLLSVEDKRNHYVS